MNPRSANENRMVVNAASIVAAPVKERRGDFLPSLLCITQQSGVLCGALALARQLAPAWPTTSPPELLSPMQGATERDVGEVVCKERLDGLLKYYEWRAA